MDSENFHSWGDFCDWLTRRLAEEMGKGKYTDSSHKVTLAKVKTKEVIDHAD